MYYYLIKDSIPEFIFNMHLIAPVFLHQKDSSHAVSIT